MGLHFSRNRQASTRILIAMMTIMLAVVSVAGTAHAAPMGITSIPKHTTSTTKHGQIQPLTVSGGGCYGSDYPAPPATPIQHDGACINVSSQVNSDGYVYAQNGDYSGWQSCTAYVWLWINDGNGWFTSGDYSTDCLSHFQSLTVDHVFGPSYSCNQGWRYQTLVDLDTKKNGVTNPRMSQWSPIQYC